MCSAVRELSALQVKPGLAQGELADQAGLSHSLMPWIEKDTQLWVRKGSVPGPLSQVVA